MGNYLSIPLLGLAATIQAGLLPLLSLQGGGPNLVFLLVLSWAINADLATGIVWAFIGGIMLDLLSALPLGTSCIALLVLVFAISGIGRQMYGLGLPTLAALTVAGTAVQQITQMVLMIILGYRVSFVQDLTYVVLPTMFYNLVLVLPVYWFTRRMQRRIQPVK